VPFEITSDQTWLVVSPSSGNLPNDDPVTVTVSVIRSRLPDGENVGHLTITSRASELVVTVEAVD
jgi:hypothetical protein